jgi:cyanate permease
MNSGKIVRILVRKILALLVIILIAVKLRTIFYACTSLLDTYCEKRDVQL